MVKRGWIFGTHSAAQRSPSPVTPSRRRWSTPTVRTLMDMAPLPGFQETRSTDKSSVVREWDLHGYGVLMTTQGVLYALDPVAYRTWQLYQEQPLDQLASLL